MKYVEAAASRGDVASQLLLADCYAGLYPNVKSDPAKVKNYLWQAVHNDSVEAIAKAGFIGFAWIRSQDSSLAGNVQETIAATDYVKNL